MKRAIMIAACLAILGVPAGAAGQVAETSSNIGENIENLMDAMRTGSAIAIAAAGITLLVSLFKSPLFGGIVRRIPARWRIAIPIVLGGIAGILYDLIAAVPMQEAVLVGVFSGPASVFGHELLVESMLGGTRTRHPHAGHR